MFKRGMVDNNIYIKTKYNYQLVIVDYVDDIIFGRCKNEICKEFTNHIKNEFEMSMVDDLSYFLVLQVS